MCVCGGGGGGVRTCEVRIETGLHHGFLQQNIRLVKRSK
jgi:hypothetical protein